MNKTFSFSDIRVLNRLEEIKTMGINQSKYISDLIIDDIENKKITLDDLARLFMAFTTMENIDFNNMVFNNKGDAFLQNINQTQETSQIKEKIQSVLEMD